MTAFFGTFMEKTHSFKNFMKNVKALSLLSVVRSENNILAAIMSSILTISEDNWNLVSKKSNRLNLLKHLFCWPCSHEKVEQSNQENLKLIKTTLPTELGNYDSLKKS